MNTPSEDERLRNLDTALRLLLRERGEHMELPETLEEKQRLLRALINVRPPLPAAPELLAAQDRELRRQTAEKGVVRIDAPGISLWQGDITRLDIDAIVNAANGKMLGCFVPLHRCIDNAIHSAAGIRLRLECDAQMRAQGHDEPTGSARITAGYNLPARHVIHTVGPIVPSGVPDDGQRAQLAACYRSCLELAEHRGLESIAFCCISTGEFRFPGVEAAEIAVRTVRDFERNSLKTVVFNVFTDKDRACYEALL